jgi:hypothetical protein
MSSYRYRNLPASVKKPLWEYYRSGGTDPREWEWAWRPIPLKFLEKELWKSHKDMREDFDSFEGYHRWYVETHGLPKWAEKDPGSVWAIMLDGPPGGPYAESVIEDGWHRFHYYLEKYGRDFEVPVVWPIKRVTHQTLER